MSQSHTAVIVTSISAPNGVLRDLAEGCVRTGRHFIVVGDTKTPAGFSLDGCEYLDVAQQVATGLAYAKICPTRSYTRKNIGYLVAMQKGVTRIVETDDDNFPREDFWLERQPAATAPTSQGQGWVNAYKYFSEANIWPRGLPLDRIHSVPTRYEELPVKESFCPIHQGLADENPDVDAVYRLVLPLPQNFRQDRSLTLSSGSWCPFNSQNTTFWPEAFPLLYLPAYCSFRMTDIWRSFVAQRILWTCGWSLLFHPPTVWQDRNEHDLMRDFADEVPGYLHNKAMGAALDALDLAPGPENIPGNLRKCYGVLIERGWVGAEEMPLLEAWLSDLNTLYAP